MAGHARRSRVATGQQERIPLRFALPADLAPGTYELTATVKFSTGETQKDSFAVHVLPPPGRVATPAAKIALFDPEGRDGQAARRAWASSASRSRPTPTSPAYDVLDRRQGRADARTARRPDVGRVRDGLKVIVFEQTAEVLEKRFGFRVAEYGLRQVFHARARPSAAGRARRTSNLRDWRGEATLLPPRLKYDTEPHFSGTPTVKWCDIAVPRVWRCGNRGNVASVLIEKPARGDFLPIVDGGFSLQYSPLMEYREGKGMVLFCQMDVTGRTESDPAAETLAAEHPRATSPTWKPAAAPQARLRRRPGRQAATWSRRASPWLPTRAASSRPTRC